MPTMKLFLFSWGLVILSAVCDSYAAFIVKLKLNEFSLGNLGLLDLVTSFLGKVAGSPLLISAGVAFVLAPFLWFLGLSRLELSAAYPANVIMHLLLIFLFSTLFLGEMVTAKKLAGACLLLFSLYLFFSPSSA